MKRVLLWLVCLVLSACSRAGPPGGKAKILTRANFVFRLDGVPISRFGLRAANALESDVVTNSLISNLDNMKAHGIQSVMVGMQGGSIGTANGFNPDGTLNMTYFNRLASILSALAARNMVGVVQYFYCCRVALANDDAYREAVRLATDFIKPWRNVWLYALNEPWHSTSFTTSILSTVAGRQEIYNIIKTEDPTRITFVSWDAAANDGFAVTTDYTNLGSPGGFSPLNTVVAEYVRQDSYTAPGIFTSAQISKANADAATTFNNCGYWFWHSAWTQKANAAGWPRYDMGGDGTAADPGVTFAWAKMQTLSATSLPESCPK